MDTALLLGAAQILFLDVPDHAAVDLSVRLVQGEKHAARYAGLVNAVLRRIAREGKRDLANLDTLTLDTPPWLLTRWTQAFRRRQNPRDRRREFARARARSHREERCRRHGRSVSAAA